MPQVIRDIHPVTFKLTAVRAKIQMNLKLIPASNQWIGEKEKPNHTSPSLSNRLFVIAFVIAMECTILFVSFVMPLRGLYLYAALPDTLLGSKLLAPTRRLFPGKDIIWSVHYQRVHPAPLSTAWKETVLLFLGFTALFIVYLLAIRFLPRIVRYRSILLATALLGITCMLYPAMPSQDIFSYITYARIGVIYHLNPLTTLPVAIHSDLVFPYIFWIHQPSAYGPTWIIITCALQWITLFASVKSLMPMVLTLRFFGLLIHLASVQIIWWLSGRLQGLTGTISREKRLAATVAFAWNPLLLLEAVVNAHNDTIILFLLLLAIGTLLPRPEGKRPLYLLAAFLLALAVCLKVTMIVLFPGLLLYLWSQQPQRVRACVSACAIFVGTIILLYAPFWNNGQVLHVFQINPGVSRVVNGPYEFLMYLYEGLRGRTIRLATPDRGIHIEILMHQVSMVIFVIGYALLCIRVLLNPRRMRSLLHLLGWWAFSWFFYCLIGSPWLWPWYFTTFFGLFALLEATNDFPLLLARIINIPLASRLFAFALLNIYVLDTWATHSGRVLGIPHFPWAYTRGLWLCVLPLFALRPTQIRKFFKRRLLS
jgi:hypothetical protein